MKFLLPDQHDDAQRLAAIGNRLAALPLGRSLITSVKKNDFDGPLPDVQVAFDRQMTAQMGTCYRSKTTISIALNPDCDDARLVSVLAHEICHIPQPRKLFDPHAEGMGALAVACSRMMEGDAFTHQFVVALGSGDDAVKQATFDAVCGTLPDETRAAYAALATRFEAAGNITQQQNVMNDIFMLVQATRLDSYDRAAIEDISVLQQGNTLAPMTPPALDRMAEFIARIQYLPARLPDARYNDYLSDDPVQMAARLLRAGEVAELLHGGNGVSLINDADTLKYSNKAQHDSVMPRR